MSGRSDGQRNTVRHRTAIQLPLLLLLGSLTFIPLSHARAETRVFNAHGEHRMGDRDTHEEAVRLTTESAKRNALGQVARYLESMTLVDGTNVREKAIHTYTAGLLVLDQQTNTVLDGNTVVAKVDGVAQIDTDEVSQAIPALGENEDPRVQLVSLKQDEQNSFYPSDQYWIGKGQGDLAKGRIVCQRVSELSARTDLAKQIRVMVKEHMVDRIRERSGRDAEQDIELTREEIVQEYLLGVKIVDRQIDEEQKICTATAVMLKSPMQPKQPSDRETSSSSSP
jgi:hypothetical protein